MISYIFASTVILDAFMESRYSYRLCIASVSYTHLLFENQYPVQPMGVSYNSYVILDEKIAVMDSVDARAAEEWLSNVARVLEGRSPDYLVAVSYTHLDVYKRQPTSSVPLKWTFPALPCRRFTKAHGARSQRVLPRCV